MESSPSLTDNLSLFQTNKALLAEMKVTNQLLLQQTQLLDEQKIELQKLCYLLNAFTSGGTPVRSYLPDSLLTAYLSVAGSALGERISREHHDPAEILKAGIIIGKEMIEELNSYLQSNAPGQQAIEKALQFSSDPWEGEQEDQPED